MERYAPAVLRFGLAALYLWFGLNQLFDTAAWLGWVPTWAIGLTGMSADAITLFNGGFEVVIGALLALGLFVRWAALVAGAHMFLITVDIGLSAIGVRDFAIAASTLALGLWGDDRGA